MPIRDPRTDQMIDVVATRFEPVDYGRIWPSTKQVLVAGEMHFRPAEMLEVAAAVPVFRRQGMTHLAIEMLRLADQPAVDAYWNGEIGRDEFLDRVGYLIVQQYMPLIDAARESGVSVVALDVRPYEFEHCTDIDCVEERNRLWVGRMLQILEASPDARVLVYCGSGHASRDPQSVNGMLAKEGIASTVLSFAGGDRPDPCVPATPFDRVRFAAESLGIRDLRFAVRPPQTERRSPDYIVHLPQRLSVLRKRSSIRWECLPR